MLVSVFLYIKNWCEIIYFCTTVFVIVCCVATDHNWLWWNTYWFLSGICDCSNWYSALAQAFRRISIFLWYDCLISFSVSFRLSAEKHKVGCISAFDWLKVYWIYWSLPHKKRKLGISRTKICCVCSNFLAFNDLYIYIFISSIG